MAIHKAKIRWERKGAAFLDKRYSRLHTWFFDEGIQIPASSSPQVIRPPLSTEAAVDPEEALAAALASCHMLFFLALAAKAGLLVESYDDEPEALLEKDKEGHMSVTVITLRPKVVFGQSVDVNKIDELHGMAHAECYIAHSIKAEVRIENRF